MPLPRPASPRIVIADLRAFLATRHRHQVVAAILAAIMPAALIFLFFLDSRTNIAPGPQLIYAESWSANRTDEEIIAKQKQDQVAREAFEAERRRQFREVERRLGMTPSK